MSTSYLSDYLSFTTNTESPRNFHLWSAISSISHLVSGSVWFDMEIYVVRLNMYINLVGPPGVKKSSAMGVARKIVSSVGGIEIAPASITLQAIIQHMGSEDTPCRRTFTLPDTKKLSCSHLSLFADELVVTLNAGGAPKMMIDFLTEIFNRWDEPFRDITKNKGKYAIIHPYFTSLACVTTDTMKSLMSDQVVTGGMSRRCIFVVEHKNDHPVAIPFLTDDEKKAKERVYRHAARLASGEFTGPYTWTEGARHAYQKWYDGPHWEQRQNTHGAAGYFLQTKAEFVFKIAMILDLASYTPTMHLTEENFKEALRLVTSIEGGANQLFAGAGDNKLASLATRIRDHIHQAKEPVHRKRIIQMFYVDASERDIKTILDTLVNTDEIKLHTEVTGTGNIFKYSKV